MPHKRFCDGCGRWIKTPRDGYCPHCGVEVRNSERLVLATPMTYRGQPEGEREATLELRRQAAAAWDRALRDA